MLSATFLTFAEVFFLLFRIDRFSISCPFRDVYLQMLNMFEWSHLHLLESLYIGLSRYLTEFEFNFANRDAN